MASTLKKNSTVDDAEYNNFIRDFAVYLKNYNTYIKNIVKVVNSTVMVENVWTDSFAQDYALWFNDESGVSDGCDKLNSALKKMDALFKTTCYTPIKDVVKLLGKDTLSSCPMIKKAYNSSTMYDLAGIKKYRKKDFGVLRMKRKSGWKAVTNASKINTMVSTIEKNITNIQNTNSSIQKLVKARAVNATTRCIEITGFNSSALTKTMTDIDTALTRFKTKTNSITNNALTTLNSTQESISSKAATVTEEN